MAKLCEDVLGDSAWRFASPRDRAGKGHLAGYDPAAAPSVVKPPYIAKARLDYYDDYWKSYWQRLRDKYTPTLGALTKDSRILFQGDSITDGNRGRSADPNHILGHGYAFIIAAKYGAAFPERNLDFVNRGNSGNTVLDLQNRWKNDTLALKPNLLSVLIGVNDNARDVPLQQYEKVYDKLLADVRAANPSVKLVLCEPFGLPVGKRKENWDAWSSSLQKRREAVARLAEKHHAALVHFQKAFDAACQRATAEHWIWDGVHPTYSGHQIMADEWIHTVDQFGPVAKQTNPN
ncbi:MAG: SGNH/GDSL hydrolase family protein [Planctomycetia bacterium]|nr:SGNH/GDSL hydrolase family protein [Planctomycetia bacterium]